MREGLQIEDASIPISGKIELLNHLSRTGLRNIVVGSFVSPKWTPQMEHIDDVVRGFTPAPGVHYTALALNRRGMERRDNFTPPLSPVDSPPQTYAHLCDVFAQRNTNRTQTQELDSWNGIIDEAVAAGCTHAAVGVGAAWGSNWVGAFTHGQRMDMIQRQMDAWAERSITVTRIFLADPMGWNLPHHVGEDIAEIVSRWPSVQTVHLHLHNTRGVAIASMYAAIKEMDETRRLVLDSSIGGMAGCPYCGNGRAAQLVPTEDLVHMLEGMGYRTGIDQMDLIRCVKEAEELIGHELFGHVSKAGPTPDTPTSVYPMEMPFIETLEEAGHFLRGPQVYEGCRSPWKEPIQSPQRDELFERFDSGLDGRV